MTPLAEALLSVMSDGAAAAAIGVIAGLPLGAAAYRGRFCTLGAIEDAAYGGDWTRARIWALALAVSIAVLAAAAAQGAVDPERTVYAVAVWNPTASIVGGLLFGYGMAIAGGCGLSAVTRAAAGDLRSVVVLLVMGIAAYAVMSGPLAWLRLELFPRPFIEDGVTAGLDAQAAGLVGGPPIVWAFSAAALLGAWALNGRAFRRSRAAAATALAVAAAVCLGWLGTAALADATLGGAPVASHSFTAPVGESILYLMTAYGGGLSFGVGSIAGVALGALLSGPLFRGMRWEACEDPRELRRQLAGAALMGVGGVVAFGCSIGQGLSAFAVLAPSAPVTAIAIVLGARIGLAGLIEGAAPRSVLSGWLGLGRSS